MNKIISLSLIAVSALTFSACVSSSSPSFQTAQSLNEKKVCDVNLNGIDKVINTAKAYNEIAIKREVEFRRLGVNNSGLIAAVEEGIKTGAKEVNPKDFKGKDSKTVLPIDFAAERACKFAISALVQEKEAQTTWRLAVPGDGYKY
ncbi:hypothetical protein CRU98_08330 [Arcobacter sp. CECT 8986]|uniref:hypothetical protein n=1 Tax=Arcobacter sp. CECT 8986 TaxID=2044507 RepID=UPI0010099C94|nr:hypothetical protein [Arcobacter sp. CECT 8986]RXJ98762.1 hypothetical protein CRU98_08330 [Arcobacter sp. CECT 8986]